MNQKKIEEKIDLINKRLIVIFYILFSIIAFMLMIPYVTQGKSAKLAVFIFGFLFFLYLAYDMKRKLKKLKGDKK